ncbi:MAG TPA: hypothetical protein VMM58_13055 [Bacteroidota bacterium]|nr:hypothetical protein [Bacteroidota bacterium]
MNSIQIPKEKFDWIVKESNHVFVLTVEIEKVLDWYRDHPHFPLDCDKVRGKIMEAHTRMEGIGAMLDAVKHAKDVPVAEDSSTDVWL